MLQKPQMLEPGGIPSWITGCEEIWLMFKKCKDLTCFFVIRSQTFVEQSVM